MKILHLPNAVGGNAWGLAQAERALGLDSTVLYAYPNPFSYPADIEPSMNTKNKPQYFYQMAKLFLNIKNNYDIFHFNYGSSLLHFPRFHLHHLELPFYPETTKKFVTYNGCDARQKYPTTARCVISACAEPDCYGGICNPEKMDKIKQSGIKKMACHVNHIWALNPDLLYFLPREKSSFLPYTVNSDAITYSPSDYTKKALHIVHAPTDRQAKGTDYVIKALESIKKKYGKDVLVSLIENVSHDEALQWYRTADLIVDQLLIGWYGGIAVEALSMGKPVICRIERKDLHFLPRQMAHGVQKAFIEAEPETIETVISNCIENRTLLKDKAEAGYDYVRRWHNPQHVAAITRAYYEG